MDEQLLTRDEGPLRHKKQSFGLQSESLIPIGDSGYERIAED